MNTTICPSESLVEKLEIVSLQVKVNPRFFDEIAPDCESHNLTHPAIVNRFEMISLLRIAA